MRFNQIIGLDEAKGSGSFDYKYWFWGKKGTSYGLGYARQPVQLDIQKRGQEAIDALNNIKNVLSTLDTEKEEELEVIERKIKANTKRLTGIVDLLSSPIIITWLNNEPTSSVTVPRSRPGDVTDSKGRNIDIVKIFRDPDTQEYITDVIDWTKVKIDDSKGDTQNTILAKFIMDVFGSDRDAKTRRAYARGAGLEGIMGSLHFKDDKSGIEVKPFAKTNYDLFPTEMQGSKKMVAELKKVIANNFAKVLKAARDSF